MTELAHHALAPVTGAFGARTRDGLGSPDRLAELRDLSRALSALLAEIDPGVEAAGSTASQVLQRLVAGRGQANDHLLLHAPLPESRLAVVRSDSDRLHQQLGRVLGDLPRCVVTATGQPAEWAVFLPALPRRADDDRSRAAARLLVSRARAVTAEVRVGVSTELDDPGDFPRAFEEAGLAASSTGLVFADDAWADIALARLRRHVGACLPGHNPLRELAEHDARKGSSFVESLTAWLRADGDTRRAAAELNVHVNTLRYRITRVQEITSLDLSDPDARVLAHLTLA